MGDQLTQGPERDGLPWDGTCPKCHERVINTLLPMPNGAMRMTYNCPDCDWWWDYLTGKPVLVKRCRDCGRIGDDCDRTREPTA